MTEVVDFELLGDPTFGLRDSQTFQQKSRRYLGNKYKLIEFLRGIVRSRCRKVKSVCDAFSGTGIVSTAFNAPDVQVIANDILLSNYVCLYTFLMVTHQYRSRIDNLIRHLNEITDDHPNYFSENFGGTYFSVENAQKIGVIRDEIDHISESESERKTLLCSLLYATDKVANTVGHYDAYRKRMDTLNPVHLRTPLIRVQDNARNGVFCTDANQLVRQVSCDLLYVDPPYNSRQYSDSYHVLENLIEWKKPELYGVAKKMDRSHIKSKFCLRDAAEALRDLVHHAECRYILLSYNSTGSKMDGRSNARISDEEILDILSDRGTVEVFETPYGTFSAGRRNHQGNRERAFLCNTSVSR